MFTQNIMLPNSIQDKHDQQVSLNNFFKQDFFLQQKDQLHQSSHGFVDLPYNIEAVQRVKELASKIIQKSFKHYVILGIGGSMLGVQAIVESLSDTYTKSKFIYVDNIDPYLLKEVVENIELKSSLFLVQSKSGQTPETIAQYAFFRNLLEEHKLQVSEHMVFVTDPKKGYLREIAKSDNITALEIPQNVGGRFSVLTPVGLLSAALAGIDVDQILKGAKYLLEQNLNLPYQLACQQYIFFNLGYKINVIMPYSSRLRSFANWTVQLISESLGKKLDNNGKEVFTGITPIPAIGATDQHSQLQLFKEGPNDKLIIHVNVEDYEAEVKIPKINNSDLAYLSNKSFSDLFKAELQATAQSLYESNRPLLTIGVEKIDGFHLGGLFMLFEVATAFLGEFMNIDAFDQPGVERGKILTKEILLTKDNV